MRATPMAPCRRRSCSLSALDRKHGWHISTRTRIKICPMIRSMRSGRRNAAFMGLRLPGERGSLRRRSLTIRRIRCSISGMTRARQAKDKCGNKKTADAEIASAVCFLKISVNQMHVLFVESVSALSGAGSVSCRRSQSRRGAGSSIRSRRL